MTTLILGKGPSARVVAEHEFERVAALNGAVRLVRGPVDWLFVNDREAFREIDDADLSRVVELVLPSELHLLCGRVTVDPTPEVDRALAAGVGRVQFYELPSRFVARPDLRSFGPILSVGETAVAWLLADGERDFATLGVDPAGGYSALFDGGPQVEKPAAHFARNWQRMAMRVRHAGGTIRRVA